MWLSEKYVGGSCSLTLRFIASRPLNLRAGPSQDLRIWEHLIGVSSLAGCWPLWWWRAGPLRAGTARHGTLPLLQILFGKLRLHLLRPQDALPMTGLRKLPSTSEAVVRFNSVPLQHVHTARESLSGPRAPCGGRACSSFHGAIPFSHFFLQQERGPCPKVALQVGMRDTGFYGTVFQWQ